MFRWNYRVIKDFLSDGKDWYSVHEVFYEDDSIYTYTEDSISVEGNSIDEIRELCTLILKCLDKPILIDGEIELIEFDFDEENDGGEYAI